MYMYNTMESKDGEEGQITNPRSINTTDIKPQRDNLEKGFREKHTIAAGIKTKKGIQDTGLDRDTITSENLK